MTKADLREYESAIRNALEKLETGLRHEVGDLRKDIIAMEQRFDAKLQRFDAKLDKLGLQIINKLGGLIVAGVVVIAALPAIFKLLR